MQRSLFLLILMGQCSFFMCHLYEYHFIGQNMTWNEAQDYCQSNYTDLATVYDMTDADRLRNRAERHVEAWIGLQSNPGKVNRMWHWSLPGVEYHKEQDQWAKGEPNDDGLDFFENCVKMRNRTWMDVRCNNTYAFICYNESKKSNKKFCFINTTVTWPQAQNYCREHHTDLVSGVSQLETMMMLEDDECKKEKRNNTNVWIGLFRDTWNWSDGSDFSFRNWDLQLFKDDEIRKCAMTVSDGSGKWSSDDCDEGKPFFCYEDKMILINENKTWEEALSHCRENYNDLVSITDLKEQRWVQERAKRASSAFVWLGLRYTCTLEFWFWVSDEVVGYENWASDEEKDNCDCSGAMAREEEHKWFKKGDTNQFNFICSKV